MAVRKTSIFGEVYLLSGIVVCAFSEAALKWLYSLVLLFAAVTTVLESGTIETSYHWSLANSVAKREAAKQFPLHRLAAKHRPSDNGKFQIGYQYFPMSAGIYWTIGKNPYRCSTDYVVSVAIIIQILHFKQMVQWNLWFLTQGDRNFLLLLHTDSQVSSWSNLDLEALWKMWIMSHRTVSVAVWAVPFCHFGVPMEGVLTDM